MRFAQEKKYLTEDAHFLDPRSKIGLRADGSPLIRLFGKDKSLLHDRVFERDKHQCVECGSTYWLQLSHDVPLGQGGSDTEENTHCRCITCHTKRDGHGQPMHF
jgi:hypothetical protein